MINTGTFVIYCVCALLLGWSMGTWKSAAECTKNSKELLDMCFKDFNLIIDKVIACGKEQKKDDSENTKV